ncbi:DUF1684 domain-containing protein [Mangrovivirga sp. M17]|uniref:DUF1684 domain-containing protein n=1 Tax=Mangrovivirga halotolerans TaxID=2993936 RepID=A0ABT3RTP8_9BACT|nr:DUF1684 domain-containing protein [Mangrovivirga halotolerans]MCX2745166.1 DUF1684 domain-containing protein [Mangrovivirga halotolerans]
MKLKIIIAIAFVIVVGVTIYSLSGNQKESWEKWKNDREEFLRNSSSSPFNEADVEFEGVNYFNYDPEFEIKAKLSPIRPQNPVKLTSTTGEDLTYFQSALATFDIKGKNFEVMLLTLTKNAPEEYHLLFTDKTNGMSTYGGGRYLEIPYKDAGNILINFNKAYYPYCAYVHDYSCPIPPRGNYIDLKITAGEKDAQ